MRLLPPVSVPSPATAIPQATATAVPPLLPPAMKRRSIALPTAPKAALALVIPNANSCMFVLPSTIAPAAFSRATAGASSVGTKDPSSGVPAVLGSPATWMLSFTAMGMPCNEPGVSPRRRISSSCRARSRAPCLSTEMKAFSDAWRSIAASAWRTSRSLDNSPRIVAYCRPAMAGREAEAAANPALQMLTDSKIANASR